MPSFGRAPQPNIHDYYSSNNFLMNPIRIVYSYWFRGEKSMLRWKCSGWCLLSVLAFVGAPVCRAQSTPVEVASPDHRITLRFTVQPVKGQEGRQDGQLVYSVAFHGKAAFENSALGLELANQPPLGARCSHCRQHPGLRRGRLHADRRQSLRDPRRVQQPDSPRRGERISRTQF